MLTEKEMQYCKKDMEEVYGKMDEYELHDQMEELYHKMNEDELRDQMENVMDKMSRLYKDYYTNWFAHNEQIVVAIDNLIHSAHVQMATIAKMLVEAKKRG